MPSDPPPPWVLTHRRAIGDRIRAERDRVGLSQEKLAERVELDRKTINRIEQGTYATSIDRLIRIASALDVPLRDLV